MIASEKGHLDIVKTLMEAEQFSCTLICIITVQQVCVHMYVYKCVNIDIYVTIMHSGHSHSTHVVMTLTQLIILHALNDYNLHLHNLAINLSIAVM